MNLFEEGDRVVINEQGHERWGVSDYNPKGVHGTVRATVQPGSPFSEVIVDWDNDQWNGYDVPDLDLVL